MDLRRVAALATAVLACAPATAATAGTPPYDPLPMTLPGARTASAATTGRWLLGVRDRATLGDLRRFAARPAGVSALSVPAGSARRVAAALRRLGRLTYAEPDVVLHSAAAPDGQPDRWARSAVVAPGLVAPAPGGARIGVIDDLVDPASPDVGPQTSYLNADGRSVRGPHGTEVASVVAAAAGNGGVMGVFPGAGIVSYAVEDPIGCGAVAGGVRALVEAHVAVINMSLGTSQFCTTLYAAVEQAIGVGIVVVASGGNEFEDGNPIEYPAAFPHVVSVAALTPGLEPAYFSNANLAIDVAAPGVDVPVAIPPAFDTEDGAADGVTTASGTSFSAPMVAGAAAWLTTARPSLSGAQLADVLRYSARDLPPKGWDRDTGWGIVDMQRALAEPAPATDPGEPNDDVPLVDGTYFTRPDPFAYRGASRSLRAFVDYAEDPYDVYRVRLPGRSALRVTVTPSYGNPDLYVFSARARDVADRRAEVAASRHARGTERLTVSNPGRRPAVGYVAVEGSRSRTSVDAGYRLTLARARAR